MRTAAADPARAPKAAGTLQSGEFLTMRLGPEEYGVDILKVQEIRGYEQPTTMANAPRGVIVPIIDLRLRFGLADADCAATTVVVILNLTNRVVGIVVDAVSDVLMLAGEQIRPAPAFNHLFDASHITGLGSVRQGDAERMLILLDIERLMGAAGMGLTDTRPLLN
jgi:purine-binding chemotaxis protein CheW